MKPGVTVQDNQAVHHLKRFYLGFWVEAERQDVCNWVDVGRVCLGHLSHIVGAGRALGSGRASRCACTQPLKEW